VPACPAVVPVKHQVRAPGRAIAPLGICRAGLLAPPVDAGLVQVARPAASPAVERIRGPVTADNTTDRPVITKLFVDVGDKVAARFADARFTDLLVRADSSAGPAIPGIACQPFAAAVPVTFHGS